MNGCFRIVQLDVPCLNLFWWSFRSLELSFSSSSCLTELQTTLMSYATQITVFSRPSASTLTETSYGLLGTGWGEGRVSMWCSILAHSDSLKRTRLPPPEQSILRCWGTRQCKAITYVYFANCCFKRCGELSHKDSVHRYNCWEKLKQKDHPAHFVRAQLHIPVYTASGLPGGNDYTPKGYLCSQHWPRHDKGKSLHAHKASFTFSVTYSSNYN